MSSRSRVHGRVIPAAVKRQVWERDRGCCSYVDRGSGRRYGSRHLLQIDHIVPFALGGSAETGNLRLLCAAHHRHAGRGGRTDRAAARPLVRSPDAVFGMRRAAVLGAAEGMNLHTDDRPEVVVMMVLIVALASR